MHFFLVKKREHDGSETINPEKTRCKIFFGFDPGHGTEIARAYINNNEIAFLENAKLFSASEIGLYIRGSEHDDKGVYYQEWLCAYDENFVEEKTNMKMTQSYLFEGM
jgi:hypothetical protein